MFLACDSVEERSITPCCYHEKHPQITGIFTGLPFSACALTDMRFLAFERRTIWWRGKDGLTLLEDGELQSLSPWVSPPAGWCQSSGGAHVSPSNLDKCRIVHALLVPKHAHSVTVCPLWCYFSYLYYVSYKSSHGILIAGHVCLKRKVADNASDLVEPHAAHVH